MSRQPNGFVEGGKVRSTIRMLIPQDKQSEALDILGGVIDQVDAQRIVVRATADLEVGDPGVDIYRLRKFQRSNQNTCINQRPIVAKGQHVRAGEVIADGFATEKGELALGKNVTVAFMPWGGYNFEDSIDYSAKLIAELRASEEGQEGMSSFLEKRKPWWQTNKLSN